MFNHIYKYTLILIAGLALYGCGSGPSTLAEEGHGMGSLHEDPHFVSLSHEQIEMVGISYGEIAQKQLSSSVRANGALRVPNGHKGMVTALFGGVVQSLHVEYGANVRKGQLIATISNPQFIQVQEDYLTVNNKIILAEQELIRQTELEEGNAGIKKDLQLANAELNNLKIKQASLKEQLSLMGINPENISNTQLKSGLELRAPLAGTVKDVYAKIGSYVDVSFPIAEIVDNAGVHLDLHVYEKDLSKLHIGQDISFTITNSPVEVYKARIFNIGSSFEDDSKTISVHCDVIGNKKGLIDGMSVRALISMDNITAPALPNEAIVESEGKHYIFIEKSLDQAEATFEKIEILKGASDMGYTEINSVKALKGDEKIIVKGAYFINAKMVNTGEAYE